MNKREAKRLAEEDSTPYGVFSRGGGGACLIRVTGYRNARIARDKKPDLILTESEMNRLKEGWRP